MATNNKESMERVIVDSKDLYMVHNPNDTSYVILRHIKDKENIFIRVFCKLCCLQLLKIQIYESCNDGIGEITHLCNIGNKRILDNFRYDTHCLGVIELSRRYLGEEDKELDKGGLDNEEL